MKNLLVVLALFGTCIAFSQPQTSPGSQVINKKVISDMVGGSLAINPTDTILLKAWQLDQVQTLSREMDEIKKIFQAKDAEATRYIEGIISQYADPKKVKWTFTKNGKLILQH